jgi:hypothetical protein
MTLNLTTPDAEGYLLSVKIKSIMLSVVMLSVVAPFINTFSTFFLKYYKLFNKFWAYTIKFCKHVGSSLQATPTLV